MAQYQINTYTVTPIKANLIYNALQKVLFFFPHVRPLGSNLVEKRLLCIVAGHFSL